MNWYLRKIISQTTFPLQDVTTQEDLNQPNISAVTSLPVGYIVRREQGGGYTILNPNHSVLVENEQDFSGNPQNALKRAIRLALLRINQRLSSLSPEIQKKS